MNILYCGDKGIERGVLVSVLSLLRHNSEPLHIYLMTVSYRDTVAFPTGAAQFLDQLVKARNRQNFVKLLDATEVFVANLPDKNMHSYFTPCSMLRLYADQMPELARLERILYLDYDVVCRQSLGDFYRLDLAGAEVAGVLDLYGSWFYHYHGLFRRDYMNSGVMLFNLAAVRQNHVLRRAVELCQTRRMLLADQSALNKAITQRRLVPRRYNEQSERPQPDTVLHHFSNNFKFFPFRVQKVKPFEVDKIHRVLKIHEYDDLLAEYSRLWPKMQQAGTKKTSQHDR